MGSQPTAVNPPGRRAGVQGRIRGLPEVAWRARTVKCLSIRQPWAWCVTHGPKRYENRPWYCRYRGPLLIHAAKSRECVTAKVMARLRRLGLDPPDTDVLVFGAIIGTCRVIDCVRPEQAADDAWAHGPWCLRLADVRAVPTPIPCRGKRGLFEVPAAVQELAAPPALLETGSKSAAEAI